MTMNPVVHFEMPYEDKQRMVDFYSKAFGWQANMLGPDMGDYVVVGTAEMDENHMIKKPGSINGGFFKKENEKSYPSVVVAVDDIHAAMKKVEESGGKVLPGSKGAGEVDEIPGIGLFISIIDTEGNRVGMLQPKNM